MPERYAGGNIKEPESLKDGDEWGSPGTRKNVDGRAMRYADVGKFGVNEKEDIRTHGVKGDTFAPVGYKKQNKRNMQGVEIDGARIDPNFVSDSTQPDCNKPVAYNKDTFTVSTQKKQNISKGRESYDPKGKKVVDFNS